MMPRPWIFHSRYRYFSILLILVAFLVTPPFTFANNKKRINLLFTSDLHGWLTTAGYIQQKKDSGLLHLLPIITQEQGRDPDTILIDAGDLLQGSPLVHYAHQVSSNPLKEDLFFKEFNRLNYDAVVVGNHDLDSNPLFEKIYKPAAHFSWIAANIKRADKTVFAPFKCISRNNISIVIIGFSTPGSQVWSEKSKLMGLTIEDIPTSVEKWSEYIERKIPHDILIGVFHSGLNPFRDHENSKLSQIAPANDTLRILKTFSKFDLVLTGHDHRLSPVKKGKAIRFVNGTPVISGGRFGEALIKIELDLKKTDSNWELQSLSATPAFAIQSPEIIASYHQKLSKRYTAYLSEQLPWNVTKTATTKSLTNCLNYLLALSQAPYHRFITALPSVRVRAVTTLYGTQLSRRQFFSFIPYDNKTVAINLSRRDLFLLKTPSPEYGFKRIPYNRKLVLNGVELFESFGHNKFLERDQFKRELPTIVTNYHFAGGGGIIPMLRLDPGNIIRYNNSFLRDDLFNYLKILDNIPEACQGSITPSNPVHLPSPP